MKACKLCDLLDHQQQKLTDSAFDGLTTAATTVAASPTAATAAAPTEDSKRVQTKPLCKHKSQLADGSGEDSDAKQESSTKNAALSLPSSFSMLSPYLKDMFFAAHLIRGIVNCR